MDSAVRHSRATRAWNGGQWGNGRSDERPDARGPFGPAPSRQETSCNDENTRRLSRRDKRERRGDERTKYTTPRHTTTRQHQEGDREETSRWRWRRNRPPQPSPPRARARAFSCGRATTTELGRCSGGGGAAAWRQRSAMRHMGGGVVLETPHTRAAALRRSSAGALNFSVDRDKKCIAKRVVMGGMGYRRRRRAAAAPLVRRALPRSR